MSIQTSAQNSSKCLRHAAAAGVRASVDLKEMFCCKQTDRAEQHSLLYKMHQLATEQPLKPHRVEILTESGRGHVHYVNFRKGDGVLQEYQYCKFHPTQGPESQELLQPQERLCWRETQS